jgi:hypothetical protein
MGGFGLLSYLYKFQNNIKILFFYCHASVEIIGLNFKFACS